MSKDEVHDNKDGIQAGSQDYVGATDDGTLVTTDPDGTANVLARQDNRLHPLTQDLTALAKRIGIAPSHSWTKGDPRRTPKGKLLRGTREASYFSIDLKVPRKSDLDEALSKSLQVVTRVKKQLRSIVASGGQVGLAVGWFCTGDAGSKLPADLLAELARSSVDLDLYLYFAPSESEEDD